MYIFQRYKQVEQVMIHRLVIYRLKQDVNNQRKHREQRRRRAQSLSYEKYAKKNNCTQSTRTKVTTGEYAQ
jgi:hypothetical protein